MPKTRCFLDLAQPIGSPGGTIIEMPSMPSSPKSTDRSIAVIEQSLWSMWALFGRARDCELHESDEAAWFETPIPVQPYNMIFRFHGDQNSDATIDRIFERSARRNVPYVWLVHPTATPNDLPDRLRRRGYDEVEELMGMIADLDAVSPPAQPPPGIEIVEVTPGDEQATYLEFIAARWSIPEQARIHAQSILEVAALGADGSPNRAWIAVRDGVALSKTLSHETADSVGLYGTATRQEARGLGLARLVCRHALIEARAKGHKTAVLHATPMSVGLYEGIGFRPVAPIGVFTEPGSFYA